MKNRESIDSSKTLKNKPCIKQNTLFKAKKIVSGIGIADSIKFGKSPFSKSL